MSALLSSSPFPSPVASLCNLTHCTSVLSNYTCSPFLCVEVLPCVNSEFPISSLGITNELKGNTSLLNKAFSYVDSSAFGSIINIEGGLEVCTS